MYLDEKSFTVREKKQARGKLDHAIRTGKLVRQPFGLTAFWTVMVAGCIAFWVWIFRMVEGWS